MYVGTNRLQVHKGTGHKLEERFARQDGVERQPGFVSFQMWKLDSDEEHEEYLIVTHWESKEAQREWIQSDAFRRAHSGARADFIIGHGLFRGYDVRLVSEPQQTKAPAG